MSANQLQQAVVERLSTDPAIVAIIGAGRIFDRLITRAEPPLPGAGRDHQQRFFHRRRGGERTPFEVEAWSKDNGRKQAVELADAVRAALHDADLTLGGAVLVNLRHERTVSRRAPRSALHLARSGSGR
jgi:hypothetical protein